MRALAYLSGLLLGLSMILPIGPQNVFVLTQGLSGSLRRGLLAAAVAGLCDTLLILIGAAGLSALFSRLPWLHTALLLTGVTFLLWLGIAALRRPAPGAAVTGAAAPGNAGPGNAPGAASLVGTGIAVSWGNPHAILDTVAVLGSAIAAQGAGARMPFAAGAVSASWLFFLALALAGNLLGRCLTARVQLWVQRGSGLLMLLFALLIARTALAA